MGLQIAGQLRSVVLIGLPLRKWLTVRMRAAGWPAWTLVQVPELPVQVPELPVQVPELPVRVPGLPVRVPGLPVRAVERPVLVPRRRSGVRRFCPRLK